MLNMAVEKLLEFTQNKLGVGGGGGGGGGVFRSGHS